jgi:hypothetical protein
MTIPIVPGRWNFLGEAGKAAGTVASALTAERARREEEAQRGVAFLMEQIQQGRIDPEALNDPRTTQLLQRAKLPIPSATPTGPEIPISAVAPGATTGGATMRAMRPGFHPSPEDTLRRKRGELISSAGPAATRALAGVPSEQVAAATESEQISKATEAAARALFSRDIYSGQAAQGRILNATADATIRATIAEDAVKQRVMEGAMRLLGSNTKVPGYNMIASDVASMVAVGIGPLLQHMLTINRESMTLERQAMADNMRLLLSIMSESSTAYVHEHDRWMTGRSDYVKQAQTQASLNDTNFKPDAAWTQQAYKEYEAYAGPEPSPDEVQDGYLRNFGKTRAEFQEAFGRAAAGLFGGAQTKPPADPHAGATGRRGGPAPTEVQRRQADIVRTARDFAALPENRRRSTIDVLLGKVHAGFRTTEDLRDLLSHLIQTKQISAEDQEYFERRLRQLENPSGYHSPDEPLSNIPRSH